MDCIDAGAITWKIASGSAAVLANLLLADVKVFYVPTRPLKLLLNGTRITRGDWHYDAVNLVLSLYDLEVPLTADFVLSWNADTSDLLLPCPLSHAGQLSQALALTNIVTKSCV
ncbi:hypothetical protein FHG87_025705 [Trinorchestia longiramus]|nr:hypothetical protein FHG87_025705 [Trinorchestia longiramus]